jgi:hypothetical protein
LLFNVPDRHALVKILDKDYAVAGIPKTDDRDRTVDVHCLRHSFATWIGKSGVSPKDAQRLMRHSDVNLTMRYTHGTAEAESKALDALPVVSTSPDRSANLATGTGSDWQAAPMFAPATDFSVRRMSPSGKVGNISGFSADSASAQKRPENPAKQGISGHPEKYTREDSNLQPPVPKTGAANHEPVSQQQFTATAAEVSATVSPKTQKVVSESDSKPAASDGRKRKSELPVSTGNGSSDAATSGDFAAALAMIATLPLSDAEKAEAVRRLLVSHGT